MSATPFSSDYVSDRCCAWKCCHYPNGPIQVIVAQIVLFVGFMLGVSMLGDCEFLTANVAAGVLPPIPEPLEEINLPEGEDGGGTRGLGFFFWELSNGECSWKLFDTALGSSNSTALEEIWTFYFDDTLDKKWDTARVFASLATFLAFVIWCSTLFMACASHARPFRYLVAALLLLIVLVFHCIGYMAFRSSLCDAEGGCELGRSGYYGVGAAVCYFFAFLCFVLMTDYPGKSGEALPATIPAVQEVAAAEKQLDDEEQAGDKEQSGDEEQGPANDDEEQGPVKDEETPGEERLSMMSAMSGEIPAKGGALGDSTVTPSAKPY